ncbi:MAG: 3-hydroxybutyrate dehydrogenase [Bacteroidetes bacterium]|jgi:3-hydroxybutyrate dehydrogenase|nr:3-hydroxybutyrate dehydrogenase [Bacteroidota bacterium]
MAKTAIITGSTSGIGLGIACSFAAKGYQLVFNGLEENGAAIAEEVAQEFGTQAFFSPANMLHPEQIQELVQQTASRFGQVDVLINNAGVQHVAPIEEFPESKWDLILGVNLSSAFHTSKAVWPGMKQRGFGRIINIASAHGLRASPYKSAYVAAKHGIVGLTKTLALEGAAHGITCNAICPGYVKTPLVEGQIADQAAAHGMSEEEVVDTIMLKKHAVKEFVSLELLGEMALFLASEKASTITGTAMPIEGGWTAQ